MYVSLWVMNFSFTGRSAWEKVDLLSPFDNDSPIYNQVYVCRAGLLSSSGARQRTGLRVCCEVIGVVKGKGTFFNE